MEYTATFVRPAPRMDAMLYQPVEKGEKSTIAVVAMHPGGNYLEHSIGPNLSSRGYTVLTANPRARGRIGHSEAALVNDVAHAVNFVKKLDGVKKVVLMGHSGGATLMSAYQAIAENGTKVFQNSEQLYKWNAEAVDYTPADGFMSLDSNWGNGCMYTFSLDPAIVDETSGEKIDPELDIYNPANGFDPEKPEYTEEFLKRYFKAQSDRNNRIIDHALDRLALINAGKGLFNDDEPLIIPAANQMRPNNKLFPQDIRFLGRTKEARPHLKKGGVVDNEVVYTVRKPTNLEPITRALSFAHITTVKAFLDGSCIRTLDNYGYNEYEAYGFDWDTTHCCTPANVRNITVPALVGGMTASWEFSAVETICNNFKSSDKSMFFVHGADHDFFTDKACESYEGEFGDTMQTMYDYVDKWLCAEGRFI